MSGLASKLLMCVCAGGTGAAIVPASKAIRHKAPTHAVARRAPPLALAAAAVPCVPAIADAGSAPALAGIDGLSPLLAIEPNTLAPGLAGNSRLGEPGTIGDILASSGGGGFNPGGGGGNGGGPGGPGGPGGGGVPVTSPAPEPTTWAFMIAGFGTLGGAMRYTRSTRTA